MIINRLHLACLFAATLMVSENALAAAVTSITVEDVGSGTPGNYSSSIDGFSGAFRFSNINNTTYIGASPFYGDIAAAPGLALGEMDPTVANPILTFTTGFLFAGSPFRPESLGPIVMDLSVVAGVMQLSVTSLPFAGEYGDPPGSGTLFVLGPQSSPPADCTYTAGNTFEPLAVHWMHQIDATHVAYKIGWSHCIMAAEDLSGSFVGFHAHWRLEGILTTSAVLPVATSYSTSIVPPPAAVPLAERGSLGGGCSLNPRGSDSTLPLILIACFLGIVYRRSRRPRQFEIKCVATG